MSSTVQSEGGRFALDIKTKPKKPPPRLVVYGTPKVGKTTFASGAEEVCLIPTEDGALAVDVYKLPTDGKCRTWQDVIDSVKALRDGKHKFKWAAIDTLNGAEELCAQAVCDRDFGGVWQPIKGKDAYNSFGKGDKATAQEFRHLLSILDQLQQERGVGIILLAHVGLHKTSNALGADYQKFGGNLNKHTWALVAGWADQIGFATQEMRVSVREGEQRAKASAISSTRWIEFDGNPAKDAGGRIGYEMPERIELSWDAYRDALSSDWVAALVDEATSLLKDAPAKAREVVKKRLGGEISEKALRGVGKAKLEALIGWLLQNKSNNNGE
jgi:hypothetical protein